MTDILRKKIALGTGMPPSILNAEQFWGDLKASVDAWMLRGLEIETEADIKDRRVVSGEKAQAQAEEDIISFTMPPVVGNGLSRIILSRGLVLKFAARRMQQDEGSLKDASPLFLSLICEDPAMLLRESIDAHLNGRRNEFARGPELDVAFTPAELSLSIRYIEVSLELTIGEQSEQITLVFAFDALKHYLAGKTSGSDQGHGTPSFNRHSLIGVSVETSEVRVDAVLERLQMSFADCARLETGQVLPLLEADQNAVFLAVDTVSGSTDISQGKLGVWKQKRAIKMSIPISENFIRDLAVS